MKIKVTREGREGAYLTTKEEIKKFVEFRCKKEIHCMIPTGPMMIGADWSIKAFKKFIDKGQDGIEVDKIAITIPPQMGHSIAIPMDKLYLFDCGEIKEEDLEILPN